MIASAGTMYVETPSCPAGIRYSAYAQVLNASDVGIAPR